MVDLYVLPMSIQKIMAVIKFGSMAPNSVKISIRGFKFGGLEQNLHTYMHMVQILEDFNFAISPAKAKSRNLIPDQVFWL